MKEKRDEIEKTRGRVREGESLGAEVWKGRRQMTGSALARYELRGTFHRECWPR